MSQSLYSRIFLAAVVVYLCVGATWTVLNLRDIPHYGDTVVYFGNARKLQAERFRGIVYPLLLAGAERCCVDGELPERVDWQAEEAGEGALPCAAPPGLFWVQLFQIAVNLLCLVYFLRVVGGVTARGQPALWLLAALLALDPLVGHFNLALMADSLAFSGMLVFCASLSALVLRRGSPWLAGTALFMSYVLVSGLRIEKRWALLVTVLVTVVGWLWLRRRGLVARVAHGEGPEGLGRRSAAAVGLVALGLVLTVTVHNAVSVAAEGWSSRETVTHFRLIFPYLEEVYDELPERAREKITRKQAELYDSHVNYVRIVMNRATQHDELVRRDLTRDLLGTVLPRRWGTIAFDTVRDAAENAFATFSFYTRIAVWQTLGDATMEKWFYSDSAVWDYRRLVFHHPRLSLLYFALFGVVAVLALPPALGTLRRRIRRGGWREFVSEHAAWLPAGVLWLVNASAFAAVVNITNVRYMVFSHVLFLALLYASAIRPLLAPDGPAPENASAPSRGAEGRMNESLGREG